MPQAPDFRSFLSTKHSKKSAVLQSSGAVSPLASDGGVDGAVDYAQGGVPCSAGSVAGTLRVRSGERTVVHDTMLANYQ